MLCPYQMSQVCVAGRLVLLYSIYVVRCLFVVCVMNSSHHSIHPITSKLWEITITVSYTIVLCTFSFGSGPLICVVKSSSGYSGSYIVLVQS